MWPFARADADRLAVHRNRLKAFGPRGEVEHQRPRGVGRLEPDVARPAIGFTGAAGMSNDRS